MLKVDFYPRYSIFLLFVKNITSLLLTSVFQPSLTICLVFFDIVPLLFDYISIVFNFFENIILVSVLMFMVTSAILAKNSIFSAFSELSVSKLPNKFGTFYTNFKPLNLYNRFKFFVKYKL